MLYIWAILTPIFEALVKCEKRCKSHSSTQKIFRKIIQCIGILCFAKVFSRVKNSILASKSLISFGLFAFGNLQKASFSWWPRINHQDLWISWSQTCYIWWKNFFKVVLHNSLFATISIFFSSFRILCKFWLMLSSILDLVKIPLGLVVLVQFVVKPSTYLHSEE